MSAFLDYLQGGIQQQKNTLMATNNIDVQYYSSNRDY